MKKVFGNKMKMKNKLQISHITEKKILSNILLAKIKTSIEKKE